MEPLPVDITHLTVILRIAFMFALLGGTPEQRHALWAANGSSSGDPNVLVPLDSDKRSWTGFCDEYRGMVLTLDIDRLAAQGVAFLRACCHSPLCITSRTAVFSGSMPLGKGIDDDQQWWLSDHPALSTLPKLFRANGYKAVGECEIFRHISGLNPQVQWEVPREYLELYPILYVHLPEAGICESDDVPLIEREWAAQDPNARILDGAPVNFGGGASGFQFDCTSCSVKVTVAPRISRYDGPEPRQGLNFAQA